MRVAMHYRNPTIVMQFVIANLLSPYLAEDIWWIHEWLMLPYLFWFTNSLVLFWYLIANGKICFFWSDLGRFLLLSLCLICMVFKFLLQFTIQGCVLDEGMFWGVLWAVCAGLCCCLRFLAPAEADFGQSRAAAVMSIIYGCCCCLCLVVTVREVPDC